jgi:hypothetical protein
VEIDLRRLELRFAETRLLEPGAVERLLQSVEVCGQLIPRLAVLAQIDSTDDALASQSSRKG